MKSLKKTTRFIKRRAVKDIPINLGDSFWKELQSFVDSITWDYKSDGKPFYIERDQACASLIILTGLRIAEVLGSSKDAPYPYYPLHKKDFTETSHEVILNRVKTEKHGEERSNIVMPLSGELAFFTLKFQAWLNRVPDKNCVIFPRGRYSTQVNKPFEAYFNWNKSLDRRRYWRIVKDTLDKFPHWFRGVDETIYGRMVFGNDPFTLKEHMGVKTIEAVVPYVASTRERDLPKAYKL